MATEGTLESYIDRRVALWEAIAGITKAFKEPPSEIQDAQLPAVVIEATGPAGRQRYLGDTLVCLQPITETVYLRPVGQHLSNTPINTSGWALIDAVDTAFFHADRNDSGGTPQAGMQDVSPPRNNGFEILPYGGIEYVAVRFSSDARYHRVFGP